MFPPAGGARAASRLVCLGEAEHLTRLPSSICFLLSSSAFSFSLRASFSADNSDTFPWEDSEGRSWGHTSQSSRGEKILTAQFPCHCIFFFNKIREHSLNSHKVKLPLFFSQQCFYDTVATVTLIYWTSSVWICPVLMLECVLLLRVNLHQQLNFRWARALRRECSPSPGGFSSGSPDPTAESSPSLQRKATGWPSLTFTGTKEL